MMLITLTNDHHVEIIAFLITFIRMSENNEINNNFLKNYSFVRDAFFFRVAKERAENLSSPLFNAAVNGE